MDNPEALVVGVVGDCPAELLLGVKQPIGTSRSVNWSKVMFQDLIRHPLHSLTWKVTFKCKWVGEMDYLCLTNSPENGLINYLLSQKLTFLPEAANKAKSHQAQDDTPLTMLSWTADKVQTSLKILFRVWGKSRSVATCKRILSFRGEVYWCCLWTCRWTIWINIVQSSLSISRSTAVTKGLFKKSIF